MTVASECVQWNRAGLLHTGDDTNRVASSQEGGQRRCRLMPARWHLFASVLYISLEESFAKLLAAQRICSNVLNNLTFLLLSMGQPTPEGILTQGIKSTVK